MGKKNNKDSNRSYKKDLDALFSNDGLVPDRFKALLGDELPDPDSEEGKWIARINEISEIKDFREYVKAMKLFVKDKQAFPDNEDFLIRCLDHPTEKVYSLCLKHIISLFERRGFERTEPIRIRISTLRSLSEFPSTLEYVDTLDELVNK